MSRATTLLAVFLVALALAPMTGASFHEAPARVPDRAYVLTMSGHSFNGFAWPDTPLLEAYLGERVAFAVIVPPLAEAHTFHLHGHPWPLGPRVIDTVLLQPGQVHRFEVVAGGVDKQAGDWMYHCHIDDHVAQGMWGVFRVYPFRTSLALQGGTLDVALDRLGDPVVGASLRVTLDGREVAAHVTELSAGRYAVHAPALDSARGSVVVTATHADHGESVARVAVGGADLALPRAEAPHDHSAVVVPVAPSKH